VHTIFPQKIQGKPPVSHLVCLYNRVIFSMNATIRRKELEWGKDGMVL
jgi:hypothetical protein